jgi:hypothetical protein
MPLSKTHRPACHNLIAFSRSVGEALPVTDGARHLTTTELERGLDHIRRSPADDGRVALIVRRPAVDGRELLDEGALDLTVGLVGDTWSVRGSSSTPDGGPNPDAQLTLINTRLAHLVADGASRAPLTGDQLHVDLDLSESNLPPGSRLHVGAAVVEITAKPHTGCQKFSARFGVEALRFVNSETGRALRLRGVNAKVIAPGTIRRGDAIRVERAVGAEPAPATPVVTA